MTDNILWSDREYTVEPGTVVIEAGDTVIRVTYDINDRATFIAIEGDRHCVTHDQTATRIIVKDQPA